MRLLLSITVFSLSTLAALAQPAPSLDQAFNSVSDGLTRGHGALCSLEMVPVNQGGYYPCVDMGPYRFVQEYGRVRAFVLAPNQPPFEIAIRDQNGARFSYQGPWTEDLTLRVADWYAYEIGGGKTAEAMALEEAGRVQAARDSVSAYLESLNPAPAAPPATAPAPVATQTVAPQVYYIVPPGFTPGQYSAPVSAVPGTPLPATSQEIPVSGIPIPALAQQGIQQPGVLVAPGVVAYPPAQ